MYIMYVDESGDPGEFTNPKTGNSQHYILSGLIVSADDWNNCLDRMKIFRRMLKDNLGLPVRVEIHASELIRINKIDAYRKIRKINRLKILELFTREIPNIFNLSKVINVCFDKVKLTGYKSFKEAAWARLIQRYDNYLKKSGSAKGIVIADGIEDNEVRALLRKMRVYNPIPSKFGGHYNSPTNHIVEDLFHRDSAHSYFVQAADAIAHTLYRCEYPKGSLKKYNVDQLFYNLEPLLLKEASEGDKMGIVRK